MTVPAETIWALDPHTKAKHEILRRYLEAWFPILGKYHQRILFIDGFCGPGRYVGGEKGSPIIALDTATSHVSKDKTNISFWFVDNEPTRIAHLQSEIALLDAPPHFTIRCECGSFGEVVGPLLENLSTQEKQLVPTFAFIDPFGFKGLPFDVVRLLLSFNRCEVFVNLMVDSINRFIEHPDDAIRDHIVETFGTEQVLNVIRERGVRVINLRLLYQEQLARHAKFVRFFEMRDRNDRPQYYLFFASNNALGHLKMKEAMWRTDETGEFVFSDATNPAQMVLLSCGPAEGSAIKLIMTKFSGQTVRGNEVRQYVEDETSYLNRHKTEALKKLEVQGLITVENKKTGGTKRKKGTFPDDVLINFGQN